MWQVVIVTVISALLGMGALGIVLFHVGINREINELIEQVDVDSRQTVSLRDYENLPLPVRRYLEKIGIDEQPVIQFARLKQLGSFRMNSEQDWLPIEAVQYISTDPAEFLWFAKTSMMHVLPIWIRDKTDATARMRVRFTVDAGAITAFVVQLEVLHKTRWKAVIRYDGHTTGTHIATDTG